MIALKHSLPLIRNKSGIAVSLERDWLWLTLQDAAQRSGYVGWSLIDDLVAGISHYLRHYYPKNVIDVADLEHAIRAALSDIGYDEIAGNFQSIPPTQGISLVHCLRSAPSINRANFFGQLAQTISQLCAGGARHFHFYGLHACVDQLESEEGACSYPRHEALHSTIVAFVRERIHSQSRNHQVLCSIS